MAESYYCACTSTFVGVRYLSQRQETRAVDENTAVAATHYGKLNTESGTLRGAIRLSRRCREDGVC